MHLFVYSYCVQARKSNGVPWPGPWVDLQDGLVFEIIQSWL